MQRFVGHEVDAMLDAGYLVKVTVSDLSVWFRYSQCLIPSVLECAADLHLLVGVSHVVGRFPFFIERIGTVCKQIGAS